MVLNSRPFILLISCACIGISAVAPADALYRCKDKNGKVSYISSPQGKCDTIYNDSQPAKKKKTLVKNEKRSSVKPPKVGLKTQASRDNKRSEILIYELEREIKRRESIKRVMTKTSDADKLAILKDGHEQNALNIVAIMQQLARLGVIIELP